MEVKIKTFDLNLQVKQNGMELEVRSPDGTKHIGDCYVTMTGIIWCKGRTTKAKGVKLTWDELAEILTTPATRAAALKSARA